MDVGRLAGVSSSAVSRTFTPGASVSAKTRASVLEASRKLGYRPNAIARTLTTKRSRMIAVVVSYLQNQFYPSVIEALSQELQRHGYHILLFVSDGHEVGKPEVDDLLLQVIQYQVDGIVLASVTMSSRLANDCQAAGVPVVLFNRTASIRHASSVTSDNYRGGGIAAQALLDSGCKRIAYIAGLEDSSTNQDRERGMNDTLQRQGRRLFARVVGNYNFEQAKAATCALFASSDSRPDGIFAANDHMAIAALDSLREVLKLRVPEDVAVVGFDNVPQAGWSAYSLTTVEQSARQMSEATAALLIEQLQQHEPSVRSIVVPVSLVERSTTRPVRTG